MQRLLLLPCVTPAPLERPKPTAALQSHWWPVSPVAVGSHCAQDLPALHGLTLSTLHTAPGHRLCPLSEPRERGHGTPAFCCPQSTAAQAAPGPSKHLWALSEKRFTSRALHKLHSFLHCLSPCGPPTCTAAADTRRVGSYILHPPPMGCIAQKCPFAPQDAAEPITHRPFPLTKPLTNSSRGKKVWKP